MIPKVNGIFSHIGYNFPSQFNITNQQLDLLFVANYGFRSVAPIVLTIHEDVHTELTQLELDELGALLNNMLASRWNRLSAIAIKEYDPIHNYSDEYHEELSEDISGNDTLTHNVTVSDNEIVNSDKTVTDGGTERHTETGTTSVTNGGTEVHETVLNKQDNETVSSSTSETRDTDETTTRTDNLKQTVSRLTDDTTTRTDNLEESDSMSNDAKIAGFNSSSNVNANSSSGSSSKHNTGTQKTEVDGEENTTTNNTGTTGNVVDSIIEVTGSESKTRNDTQTGTDTLTIRGGLTESTSGSKESTIVGGLTHTTEDERVTEGTKRTTGTEATNKSSERTRSRDFTHLGNIGNLTTQQLVKEEIELWRWNFIEQVLCDVKDFLTIPCYL